MPDAGNGSVQLLEADPELARGLDPRRVREVSQRLFARAIDVPRGPWSPARALAGGTNPIGLLVIVGVLILKGWVQGAPFVAGLTAISVSIVLGGLLQGTDPPDPPDPTNPTDSASPPSA